MQFDCICFVFFGQACFVVLVQALRFLFATPLPLGRWGNCMFNVKVLQAQRPFISFHVFSGRRCTFFCVQVGCRPCWSRLCVVFRNAIAVWQVGQLHVSVKSLQAQRVFFGCGVFSRKMCCKRFLLMRFCTTLFALFHV
ncbi:unknown [Corallococcus sp. CAG:1435]|nr:unknown [Corallococcus sp. CAG:1435]